MLKNLVAFFAVLLIAGGAYAVEAYAAPSVRQLGTNVSTGTTEKPVAALPSLPKANTDVVKTVKAQADKESVSSARMPVLKTISSVKIKPVIPSSGGSSGSAGGQSGSGSGVSTADFNELESTVNTLSATVNTLQANALKKEITESGSGNYVKDVTVSNNKLNVEKTNLMIAPVRTGSYSGTVNGEIWLVE